MGAELIQTPFSSRLLPTPNGDNKVMPVTSKKIFFET